MADVARHTCTACGKSFAKKQTLNSHFDVCRNFKKNVTDDDIRRYGDMCQEFPVVTGTTGRGEGEDCNACPQCNRLILKGLSEAGIKNHYQSFHIAARGKLKCQLCGVAFLSDLANARLTQNMYDHLKYCRRHVVTANEDEAEPPRTVSSPAPAASREHRPHHHTANEPQLPVFEVAKREGERAQVLRPRDRTPDSWLGGDVSPQSPVRSPYTSPPYYAPRTGGAYSDPADFGYN